MKNENEYGLIGKNISLKALEEKDLDKIFAWKNNYELANLIKTHPLPVARYEIEEWLKRNQSDKNQILWGIYDLKSDELLGIARLMFIDWISSNAEFGIFIGSKSGRGKGLGKETTKMVLNFAFNDANLHKVYLKVTESNAKAIGLYESCGFDKEGLLKHHFWNNGKYENIVMMGLLKNEHSK